MADDGHIAAMLPVRGWHTVIWWWRHRHRWWRISCARPTNGTSSLHRGLKATLVSICVLSSDSRFINGVESGVADLRFVGLRQLAKLLQALLKLAEAWAPSTGLILAIESKSSASTTVSLRSSSASLCQEILWAELDPVIQVLKLAVATQFFQVDGFPDQRSSPLAN